MWKYGTTDTIRFTRSCQQCQPGSVYLLQGRTVQGMLLNHTHAHTQSHTDRLVCAELAVRDTFPSSAANNILP